MRRFSITLLLGLIVVGIAAGQSPEATGAGAKIDEFGMVPDCEFGARVDALYIAHGNNEGAQGYVIIYRGARSAPAGHEDSVFENLKRRWRWAMEIRKYDESRVFIIDGGFRDIQGVLNELWIVPPGRTPPIASETVERPAVSFAKTLIADRKSIWLEGAQIWQSEPETDETSTFDVIEMTDEPVDETVSEEVSDVEPEEEEVDSIFDQYPDDYSIFRSSYLENLLLKNPEARGVLIFYADADAFDIGKATTMIEDDLRGSAAKTGFDLKRVDVIYGGFRKASEVEFWFVPKGGSAPVPTPEAKPEKSIP